MGELLLKLMDQCSYWRTVNLKNLKQVHFIKIALEKLPSFSFKFLEFNDKRCVIRGQTKIIQFHSQHDLEQFIVNLS